MKVRFAGAPDNAIGITLNYDDLTVGAVYDVIGIPLKDRNLLLISNDRNYERYYHKAGFVLAHPSDDDACRYLEDVDICSHKELSKAIMPIKSIRLDPDAMRDLINALNKYPDETIKLFNLLNDETTYAEQLTVPTKNTKCFLNKYAGVHYKTEPRDKVVRILSKDDYKLAGRHIYIKVNAQFHSDKDNEA